MEQMNISGFWKISVITIGLSTGFMVFLSKYKLYLSLPPEKDKDEDSNLKLELDRNQKHVSNAEDNDIIPELPQPRWTKVGKVAKLFFYPLKSGSGIEISNCNFTEFGISVEEEAFILQDRMFIIYDEIKGRFVTARQHPTLILVKLLIVNSTQVKLKAPGMPDVIFEIPKLKKFERLVKCYMWWDEPLKCIDCGPEAAKWISRYVLGENTGYRLGYSHDRNRHILKGPWKRFTKVYKTLRNQDTGIFSDLASYMLITESSMDQLNQRLEKSIPALQLRPNLLVSGSQPFAEDNWEWIKIGKHVILRNIKPCPRCSMVRVDPYTGIQDAEEPLKTLKTFRQQTDSEKVAVDGTAPIFGVYCGLYHGGKVAINDEIFVHVPS
ncbi:mitochondrial amidoxime-reducing component 1 [Orussus abietinus]|uniref:mitochondrial amidoxime-reducing component 1 n=1 Tax=Orussus abietinus TaxID=222816 RepID=UPI0006257899|nr:mitochondrial amidoxime-reducing component 1 [Orussus abietinus]